MVDVEIVFDSLFLDGWLSLVATIKQAWINYFEGSQVGFLESVGYLDAPAFADELGIKVETLWSYSSKDEDFPKGEAVGSNRVWSRAQVDEYKAVRERRKTERKVGRPVGYRKPKA